MLNVREVHLFPGLLMFLDKDEDAHRPLVRYLIRFAFN